MLVVRYFSPNAQRGASGPGSRQLGHDNSVVEMLFYLYRPWLFTSFPSGRTGPNMTNRQTDGQTASLCSKTPAIEVGPCSNA